MRFAMPNEWLHEQGLLSLKQLWIGLVYCRTRHAKQRRLSVCQRKTRRYPSVQTKYTDRLAIQLVIGWTAPFSIGIAEICEVSRSVFGSAVWKAIW